MSATQVFLVAFTIESDDREAAQLALLEALGSSNLVSGQDTGEVSSWWVAEDDRLERSDNDSAIFVHKGKQEVAADLLFANDLTHDVNTKF